MKLVIILVILVFAAAQDQAQPTINSESPPPNTAEGTQAAATQNNQPPELILDPHTQNATPDQQANKNTQGTPTVQSTTDSVDPVQAQTPPSTPTSLEATLQSPQATQPVVVEPVRAQSIHTIHDTTNLNEQQKKLLQQERIRVQLHQNQQLKLQDVANLSEQHHIQKERTLRQEARKAYQRMKQERLQRLQRQRIQQERLAADGRISRTEQIGYAQRTKSAKLREQAFSKYNDYISRPHSEYKFELQANTVEEFMIRLPIDHPIFMRISVYTNKDGVYSRTVDVNQEGPLRIKVTQNDYNFVSQTQFYFQDVILFEGQAHSTYKFSLQNSDRLRLVIINMVDIVQSGKIEKTLKTDEFNIIGARATDLNTDINDKFAQMQQVIHLEQSNRKVANQALKKYSWYMLGETAIVIALCLLQVEGIRRMLLSDSVV